MALKYIKIYIFTKNVLYMTNFVPIDSQESKESGDTKIIRLSKLVKFEASYGLRRASGIHSRVGFIRQLCCSVFTHAHVHSAYSAQLSM
jgi:hypothetical protein